MPRPSRRLLVVLGAVLATLAVVGVSLVVLREDGPSAAEPISIDGERVSRAELASWAGSLLPDDVDAGRCAEDRACTRRYSAAYAAAADLEIIDAWNRREADRLGVSLTPAEIAEIRRTVPGNSPNSDLTRAQRIEIAMRNLLAQKLRAARLDRLPPVVVSDAEAERRFRETREGYQAPERRSISYVATRSRARAERAVAALRRGTAFSAVLSRYSEDTTNLARAGVINDRTRAEFGPVLGAAVFARSLDVGEIGRVVEDDGLHYAFVLQNLQPAIERSEAEVRRLSVDGLRQAKQQQRDAQSEYRLQARLKESTRCRAPYRGQFCAGGPRLTTPEAIALLGPPETRKPRPSDARTPAKVPTVGKRKGGRDPRVLRAPKRPPFPTGKPGSDGK